MALLIVTIIAACVKLITIACESGPEPTVRPVRFWPDHFFLGAHPLLVKAWDWHLQRNR